MSKAKKITILMVDGTPVRYFTSFIKAEKYMAELHRELVQGKPHVSPYDGIRAVWYSEKGGGLSVYRLTEVQSPLHRG